MYILEFYQDGTEIQVAIFDTLEDGRAFLSLLPSYEVEDDDVSVYEYITARALPDYMEVEFKGNIIPISRFMFPDRGRVEVFWEELPNLSEAGSGMVEGYTRVDAYSIPNGEVKEYIANREETYESVKAHLGKKGFEVCRSFHGSQDGEAILYRKSGSKKWHFLSHLDPSFCDQENVLDEVDDIIFDLEYSL